MYKYYHNKKNLILHLIFAAFVMIVVSSFSSASTVSNTIQGGLSGVSALPGQVGSQTSKVPAIINNVLPIIFGFVGLLFFIFIFYAGFLWLTAAGNEDQITKSKQIMIASVIGLAVIVAASLITYWVMYWISGAVGAPAITTVQ